LKQSNFLFFYLKWGRRRGKLHENKKTNATLHKSSRK
jgi:hypothetical protein